VRRGEPEAIRNLNGASASVAAVAGSLQKLPEYAPLPHWAPVACWSVAGAGLLVIAASRVQQRMQLRRASSS
jgi:hypothetical protein